MRLAVVLILTLLGGCASLKPDQASNRTGSLSADEREALHQQAREQYIATTRPALQ
jgi:outer membrane murein-binding lipoprotein Lpp